MAVLFYMFLSLCLGFVIGWVFGEQVARRRNAEELVEDLRRQLELTCSSEQQLKQMVAYSMTHISTSSPSQKASENPPSQSHKINGRIFKIRPFQKVWVKKHNASAIAPSAQALTIDQERESDYSDISVI